MSLIKLHEAFLRFNEAEESRKIWKWSDKHPRTGKPLGADSVAFRMINGKRHFQTPDGNWQPSSLAGKPFTESQTVLPWGKHRTGSKAADVKRVRQGGKSDITTKVKLPGHLALHASDLEREPFSESEDERRKELSDLLDLGPKTFRQKVGKLKDLSVALRPQETFYGAQKSNGKPIPLASVKRMKQRFPRGHHHG